MTIQQLEYIIALENYQHFLQAAESCGITQPTLSATIAKLEDELDTQIFDRSQHPIKPTEAGTKILTQAKTILRDIAKMKEMVLTEREKETGTINMGVIITIAPYIVPSFIKKMQEKYPFIDLHVKEAIPDAMSRNITKGEIDIALTTSNDIGNDQLFVPIYHERFVLYVSPQDPLHSLTEITGEDLDNGKAWLLNEDLCSTNQLKNIINIAPNHSNIYFAGSVDTLVRIVDHNGGFAVIPECHIGILSEEQAKNVRPINTPIITREVGLAFKKDFVKEKHLNIVAECVRAIIPSHMVNPSMNKTIRI